MKKRSVRDLDVQGSRVLLRADLNVPLRDGDVADDWRIRSSLQTIEYLIEKGAAIVVCSHLGRPGGQVDPALSLAPVARQLTRLLSRPVAMVPALTGPDALAAVDGLEPGQIALLENLRYDSREEANDPGFASELAALADSYVNDAFGTAHRAHASTEGVAHLLPAAAGLLLEREVTALGSVFDAQGGKRAVISGGAKVSSKLALLQSVVQHAAVVCLGGAMANTFLLARGVDIGASLAEPEMVAQALEIEQAARQHDCHLLIPVDGVVAHDPDAPQARPINFAEERVPDGFSILDVGPRTIEHFSAAIADAATVVWNGPLGLFEKNAFAGGTEAMAHAIASLDAQTIVAGGETVQAVHQAGVADRISHISSGGGAALELLEGRDLPGVVALPDATQFDAPQPDAAPSESV